MRVWLLVDCNYMCWRAFHTTGGLSHGGVSTGVSFGFLRDIENIMNLHGASNCVLAFDGGTSHRVKIDPKYKASRRDYPYTDGEKKQREIFFEEVDRLRSQILPEIGFRNIIRQRGFEADDVIAKVANELPDDVEAVIVSADGDLLQCLSDRVVLYNPTSKKVTTAKSFYAKWGIQPCLWASVKAIAGCGTDDVQGIKGIGETYAAKWVAGTLKQSTAAYKKISENLEVFNRNIDLVRLPFPGLELPDIVDDEFSFSKLARTRAALGIRGRKEGHPTAGFEV